jgi:hypothetical protein
MLQHFRSDDLIEVMVMVNCGDTASAQARHIYRESLRSLVRLAKAERNDELRHTALRSITKQGNAVWH